MSNRPTIIDLTTSLYFDEAVQNQAGPKFSYFYFAPPQCTIVVIQYLLEVKLNCCSEDSDRLS